MTTDDRDKAFKDQLAEHMNRQAGAPYELGDRVQATRFWLMRQRSTRQHTYDATTVGAIQKYKTPDARGRGRVLVRWFIPTFPHYHEEVMRWDQIEPLGTKR